MSKSVFDDQATFMQACGQTVDQYNADQVNLYARLVAEEAEELDDAIQVFNEGRNRSDAASFFDHTADVVDAALDIIVVAAGVLHSFGFDPQPLWDEVVRSNMAKVDPETGKVRRRHDGKILKPDGWTPPDLKAILWKVGGGNE